MYYLHDLRDEPQASWLAGFLDHGHLDNDDLCGEFVIKGTNAGLNLMRVDWEAYLRALIAHPTVAIEVEIASPNRGYVSERERANPFLEQQNLLTIKYEEIIEPTKVALRLVRTAQVLLSEAKVALAALEASDTMRAQRDGRAKADLHSAEAFPTRNFRLFKHDQAETTPLSDLNERALHRFCTVHALDALLVELEGLPAAEAARRWLVEWADEWRPRLVVGADDAAIERSGRAPPGTFRRPYWLYSSNGGADASDAIEAIWQTLPFHDDPADVDSAVNPLELATRLRQLRAIAAADAAAALGVMHGALHDLEAVAAAAEAEAAAAAPGSSSARARRDAPYKVARPYDEGYAK